ncbi:MAG: hypothetical protein EPN88_08815 [Bacteroidetes bacterium]|nr:MAG: hypothetical protein EPN88_08815 [Bacteroidota bacterium]
METGNEYKLIPGFGNSFGTGWKVMMDNFLRLFLVVIILSIIAAPFKFHHFNFNMDDFHNLPWNFGHEMGHTMRNLFALGSLGIFAVFFGLLTMLYAFLVAPVFNYGGKMIFVQAVRKAKPDFEYLIKGFMENYLPIILANLLVFALVVLGLFALIIPGIIIGCRLVFVSYIIMDKKLDPIEAVELSWKLTRGHGWKIFFMGLVSIFIIIFGLLMLIVGIFPAIIWVSSSFASLYESVLREKEKPVEVIAA